MIKIYVQKKHLRIIFTYITSNCDAHTQPRLFREKKKKDHFLLCPEILSRNCSKILVNYPSPNRIKQLLKPKMSLCLIKRTITS